MILEIKLVYTQRNNKVEQELLFSRIGYSEVKLIKWVELTGDENGLI